MKRIWMLFMKFSLVVSVLTPLFFCTIVFGQREMRVGPQDRSRSNDMYGAISYSKSSDRCGTAYNYRSRAEAESKAMSECGESDCETKIWFKNGCGALATSSDRTAGWAWAGNRSSAERRALQECGKRGNKCKVRCWSCTNR